MPDREDRPEMPAGTQDGHDSDRVVRFVDYEPRHPDRILADLRAYWDGIRKGRAVPARSDVDPRGIARALDYAFILERIAPGAGRLRLAGRHLIDLMGMEVRGMPICAFLNTNSRGRFSDVLESVFKAPQIARLTLHAQGDYARPELSAQMLLLPLRSDLGDVTRILGCLVAEGETGVAPRRFDLKGDEMLPIIDGGRVLAPSPSQIGFAEEPERFDHAPATTPEERRALFRVIGPGDGD